MSKFQPRDFQNAPISTVRAYLETRQYESGSTHILWQGNLYSFYSPTAVMHFAEGLEAAEEYEFNQQARRANNTRSHLKLD